MTHQSRFSLVLLGSLCLLHNSASASTPPPASPSPNTNAPNTSAPNTDTTHTAPREAPPESWVLFELGTEKWLDVSGHGGSGKTLRVGAVKGAVTSALHGFSMQEAGDKPCLVEGFVQTLKDPDLIVPGAGTPIRKLCTNAIVGSSVKTIKFTQRKFVRGVQVCTSGQSDTDKRKIKGLKLWYSTVAADGTVTKSNSPTSWDRPNCSVWHPARYCGDDKVARAAKFHTDPDGKYFTGIALECMKPIKP